MAAVSQSYGAGLRGGGDPCTSSGPRLLSLPRLHALDQPASLWPVSALSTSLNLTAAINRGSSGSSLAWQQRRLILHCCRRVHRGGWLLTHYFERERETAATTSEKEDISPHPHLFLNEKHTLRVHLVLLMLPSSVLCNSQKRNTSSIFCRVKPPTPTSEHFDLWGCDDQSTLSTKINEEISRRWI